MFKKMDSAKRDLYQRWIAQKVIGVIIVLIGIGILMLIKALGGVDQYPDGTNYVNGTFPLLMWVIGGYMIVTPRVMIKKR